MLDERLKARLADLAERAEREPNINEDVELLLRLLGLVVDLHEWHQVDKYGQCRRCWLQRWRWQRERPKRCPVVESIEYFFDEQLRLIWWQVLGSVGRACTLDEVTEWLERTASATVEVVSGNNGASA